MFHKRPPGLNTLVSEAGNSLAKLNALEGVSRSVLVGVRAFAGFGSAGIKAGGNPGLSAGIHHDPGNYA